MTCISVSLSTLSCNLLTTVMSLVMLVAIFSTVSKVIVILRFNYVCHIRGSFWKVDGVVILATVGAV